MKDHDPREGLSLEWQRKVRWITAVVLVLTLGNFLLFVVMAGCLGGDALSGKVVGQHYYLSNHGAYTEVSRGVFTYSKWHEYFLLTVWALGGIGALVGFIRRVRERAGLPWQERAPGMPPPLPPPWWCWWLR